MAAADPGSQLAVKRWLIDTGPLVAYLDRADPMHDIVAGRFDRFSGRLATTGAVVAEVMYFISEAADGPTAFAELLVRADVQIADVSQASDVAAAAALMKKYADTPMDFADATLVLLAEALGVLEIATLDRRGFSSYRTRQGKQFRLVLDVE